MATNAFLTETKENRPSKEISGDQSKRGRDHTWAPLTTKWDEKKIGRAQKKTMWLSPFREL